MKQQINRNEQIERVMGQQFVCIVIYKVLQVNHYKKLKGLN
ncbi:hypothetical protein LLB_1193 [Legionella longbeachae D-4968]|nr:hypothetical protein LLB_1193 [Legionella longbeachae D-4968]